MPTSEVDDFLAGNSGGPSLSWKGKGKGDGYRHAKVVSSRLVQQRKYPNGEPLFWKRGEKAPTIEPTDSPVQQIEITLHHPDWVGEIDKDGRPNVEGVKRDFFSGSRTNERSKLGALIVALKKAEAGLQAGGDLSCGITGGEGTPESPREWKVTYEKPVIEPDDDINSWLSEDEEPF